MAIGITLAKIIDCDLVFHWLCRCVATVTIASICALSKLNVIMSCYRRFWFKFVAQQRQRHLLLSTWFILLLVCCGVQSLYLKIPNSWLKTCTLQILTVIVLLLCVLLPLHWFLHCVRAVYSSNNAEVLLVIISRMSDIVEQEEWNNWISPFSQWRRHCKLKLHRLTLKLHWPATLLGTPAAHVGVQNCHSLDHFLGHCL